MKRKGKKVAGFWKYFALKFSGKSGIAWNKGF